MDRKLTMLAWKRTRPDWQYRGQPGKDCVRTCEHVFAGKVQVERSILSNEELELKIVINVRRPFFDWLRDFAAKIIALVLEVWCSTFFAIFRLMKRFLMV